MGSLSKKLLGAVAGCALAVGLVAGAQAQSVPESEDPIVIAINEWTGQHITATIAGQILQRMGYNVEYVTAGVLPMANAIADSQITLGLEMWDNNLGEFFPPMLADGSVADVGDVGLDAREGWLYPKHVEALCPGLPDWDAFIGCAELFATPETFPEGRLLAYPADWSNRSEQIIAGTGIPFVAVPAGSEGALVAELNSAVERDAPLVMMFWAPHWVLFTNEYGWIDMPEDIVNEYSLQKPRVFKTAWPGMEQKWPAAWRFINAYHLNNQIQEELMGRIDNGGEDLTAVCAEWVDNNQDYWQPFVDQAMAGGT
jgi:glycine betaine/proline transport system substrate-binding protein